MPRPDQVGCTDVLGPESEDAWHMTTDRPALEQSDRLVVGMGFPRPLTRPRPGLRLPPAYVPQSGRRGVHSWHRAHALGGKAQDRRCDERISLEDEFSARVWSDNRTRGSLPVLNLSGRGMLLATEGPGEDGDVRFELVGGTWRFAGRGRVVRRGEHSLALNVLEWDGCTQKRVRALVRARGRAKRLGSGRVPK
jgi:hypothetical protein